MQKTLDYPPVWLVALAGLAWVFRSDGVLPAALSPPGIVLVLGGLVLAALAAYELRRHETTIIPHETADTLVTSGVFSRSRNPIYLADVIILVGLGLIWGSTLGLVLAPVLAVVLERRFILPEEARLAAKFGADFDAYREMTRRWL